MQDIKSMTPEELRAYLKELGQPDFRAKQIFRWLHKPVTSFDEMRIVRLSTKNPIRGWKS